MELTKEQTELKQAIVDHLMAEKKSAYNQAIIAQQADMGEAEETNQNEEGLYEHGKVDQAINRVRAKAQVSDQLAKDINLLEGIMDHIEPTEKLQLGDVIKTDRGNFFVAVVSDAFEVKGHKFIGISTDSPFYQAAIGSKSGDVVSVSGNDFVIHEIF